MELHITKHTTLGELKKQFASRFPNLKLEFSRQSHRQEQDPVSTSPCFDQTAPGLREEGVVIYGPTTTVADFEKRLQNKFGLRVQVFRRSDGFWINTVRTKDWSLGRQNAMGAAGSRLERFNIHSLFL